MLNRTALFRTKQLFISGSCSRIYEDEEKTAIHCIHWA